MKYKSQNKEKKEAYPRLNRKRIPYQKFTNRAEVVEKDAIEQPLLQKSKVKYGDNSENGEFTKAFKRENNVALGLTGVVLLLSVASATLLSVTATVATAGLVLIPVLTAGLALWLGKSILRRKKKYSNMESGILKRKLPKENKKHELQKSKPKRINKPDSQLKTSLSTIVEEGEEKEEEKESASLGDYENCSVPFGNSMF